MTPRPLVLRFSERLPAPKTPVADLSRLQVESPSVPALSEDDVLARFSAVLRALAVVHRRPKGQPVEAGDEVIVDVLTWSGGRLLPFGSASGMLLTVEEQALIPSLARGLIGVPVGSSVQVQGAFPTDYAVPSLAGRRAVFLADVKQAASIELPPVDEATVSTLGLGKTLEEVFSAITVQLERERQQHLAQLTRLATLKELVRRTPFELPKAYLEHEVGRRWLEREGRFLSRRQLSEAELTESFEGWLAEPTLVADVEAETRGLLLIRRLLETGKLGLGPSDLVPEAARYIVHMGATNEVEAKALLDREDPERSPVVSTIVLAASLDRLVKLATLTPSGGAGS